MLHPFWLIGSLDRPINESKGYPFIPVKLCKFSWVLIGSTGRIIIDNSRDRRFELLHSRR